MTHNDGCLRRRRVALVLTTIWLSGCVTVGLIEGVPGTCPFVVA